MQETVVSLKTSVSSTQLHKVKRSEQLTAAFGLDPATHAPRLLTHLSIVEEEGDDADADLDADGRKKLTVRQQCLRLFSLVIFVVLFPFVVIALGAYRAASVVRGLFARRRRVER